MPVPKPGEKPEGPKGEGKRRLGRPEHDDGPEPKPEDGRQTRRGQLQPPMPEVVKSHYEERPGYANYYFNRLQRDRVLKAWKARGAMAIRAKTWTLSGPLEGDVSFSISVDDAGAVLKLPRDQTEWTAGDELGSSLLPAGSGGLLPALYLTRRLAVVEPDRFGEVSYYGTAPLPGHAEPADVVTAIHGGVECRFYFDPQEGLLWGMEMFPAENADPCEIYFSDYRPADSRPLPQKMTVVCGNETFGTFTLQRVASESAK
jgi:hypothetical protein